MSVIRNGKTIKGDFADVVGNGKLIKGDHSKVTGDDNTVTGDHCCVYGNGNRVKGDFCNVEGNSNDISGDFCDASGIDNVVTGDFGNTNAPKRQNRGNSLHNSPKKSKTNSFEPQTGSKIITKGNRSMTRRRISQINTFHIPKVKVVALLAQEYRYGVVVL